MVDAGVFLRTSAVAGNHPTSPFPLAEASREVVLLSEELARKTEDTARQQEEISQLLAQVVDLQHRCRMVSKGTCGAWLGNALRLAPCLETRIPSVARKAALVVRGIKVFGLWGECL